MQQFIDLTPSEQNELILRTSSATKISPLLLEKDFWVSWLLNKLFQMDLSKHLIFKGGTSLSKCYGMISRFSEDCDITIDKSLFSEGTDNDMLSGKQFQKLLEINDRKAAGFVHTILKTEIEKTIKNSLKPGLEWRVVIDDYEPKNLRFVYPSAVKLEENFYIKQSVLIEMGIRGDISPWEEKTVKSYIEEQFPELLKPECAVIRTLSPVRTFWEKVTLLHAENNRPKDKSTGDRLSRHYYDLYKILHTDIPEKAFEDLSLLKDVIDNKKRYFRSAWAHYEKAIPGSLKITPQTHLLEFLEADYQKMSLMIFGEIPKFNEIINAIQSFEEKFNQLKLPSSCVDF